MLYLDTMKQIFLYILSAVLLLSGCARNPVTGDRELRIISENQERQIGKEAYMAATQAQGGHYIIDPQLNEYVSRVGHKVAAVSDRPTLEYEFVIINDSIPNAWALPGGKIAINRGLLVELSSEAELAAVLGHEIVHAAARHGAKGIERGMLLQGGVMAVGIASQKTGYSDVLLDSASAAAALVMSKYSRHQELESDHYGMIYMAKAGYNPDAAIRLQELFLRLSKGNNNWLGGLFASHPPSEERIAANKITAQTLTCETEWFEGREEYQAAIKTLLSQKQAYEYHKKGEKALKKKSHSTAENYANQAIESLDNEALFWNLKGKVLLAQKHSKDALTAFNKAIDLNPNFFESYLKRAECKKLLGDTAGAKSDAQKSIQLLPTGEAHEILGRIALQNRDKKRAMYHLQIASQANSPAGYRAKKLLQAL